MGFPGAVADIPGCLIQCLLFVARVVVRRGPGPAGVFPLGLRGKTTGFMHLLTQCAAEFHGVSPRDTLYRPIVAGEITGVTSHDGSPLSLGNWRRLHPKRFPYGQR